MNDKDMILEEVTNKLIVNLAVADELIKTSLEEFPEFSGEMIKDIKLIESLNGDNASVYISSFSVAGLNFRSICTFIGSSIHISIYLIARGESFSKCLKIYNTIYNVEQDTKIKEYYRYLALLNFKHDISKNLQRDFLFKKDDVKNIDIINIYKSKDPEYPRFSLLNVKFNEGFSQCSEMRVFIDRKNMNLSYCSLF